MTIASRLTHSGMPAFDDGTTVLTADGRPVYRAALSTTVGVSSDGEHVFGFVASGAAAPNFIPERLFPNPMAGLGSSMGAP